MGEKVRTNNTDIKPVETGLTPPLSIGDQVYQWLSERIIGGQLKPGDRLRIQDLAKTLKVSDTPVREALIRLQHSGLVETIPRAESRVRIFTHTDIEEIYDIREALECFAAKRAAERMPESDLNELQALMVKAGEALDDGEVSLSVSADIELHARLIQSTGNARIAALVANIRDQIQVFRRLGARTLDVPKRFLKHHQLIIETLRRRDPEGAVRLMEEHIQLAREQALKDYLRADAPLQPGAV